MSGAGERLWQVNTVHLLPHNDVFPLLKLSLSRPGGFTKATRLHQRRKTFIFAWLMLMMISEIKKEMQKIYNGLSAFQLWCLVLWAEDELPCVGGGVVGVSAAMSKGRSLSMTKTNFHLIVTSGNA